MTVEASGQDVINWLKWWVQAQQLGSSAADIPAGMLESMQRNIEYFEAGGEFHSEFVRYKGQGDDYITLYSTEQ